jgi:hypothetical protein
VSSTITFTTTVPAEATVKAALMIDLGVSSFTSFSVTASRRHLLAGATVGPLSIRPVSVYRLGKLPIQSCGQSVSALRGKRYTEVGLLRQVAFKRGLVKGDW